MIFLSLYQTDKKIIKQKIYNILHLYIFIIINIFIYMLKIPYK